MLSKEYLTSKVLWNFAELQGALGSSNEVFKAIEEGLFIVLEDDSIVSTYRLLEGISYTKRLSMLKRDMGIDSDGIFSQFIGDCMYASEGQWVGYPLTEEQETALSVVIDDFIVSDGDTHSDINKAANYIEDELSGYEINQFLAAIEYYGNFDDAQEKYAEIYHLCDSTSKHEQDKALVAEYLEVNYELAQQLENNWYVELNEDSIARDMRMDYELIEVAGETWYTLP